MSRLRRIGLLAAVLLPLTTSCDADLADGNPCRALAEASCNWLARCHLLPGGEAASTCLSNAQEEKYSPGASVLAPPGACSVSAGSARSCASDLDSYNCPVGSVLDAGAAPGSVPASCQAVGFDPFAYEATPNSYTPSFTCGTLVANMENDSYVQVKGSCSGGTTTLPSVNWVADDPNSTCVTENGLVAQAIANCVSAQCQGPLDPTAAKMTDQAAVSAVSQVCGAVPPGVQCLFESQLLWPCGASTIVDASVVADAGAFGDAGDDAGD